MAVVFPGRYTAQTNDSFADPFVVFLIGMRINRIFALRKWTRVTAAMPSMIAELKRNPALGMLHAEFFLYWRGVAVVQYWRSFDHLHAYAHDRKAAHLPAWHETYMVAAGQYECIYANMPRFGLAGAAEHVAVTGRLDSARGRIGKESPGGSGPAISNTAGEPR